MTGFEVCDPRRAFYRAGEAAPADGARFAAVAAGGLHLELDPLGPETVLEGELFGRRRLRVCRALVEERGERFACLGLVVEDEPGAAALRRSIGVILGDGALLAIGAARPEGAAEHGAEEVVGALVEPTGQELRFEETLLSTEYDGDGRHRRATLELGATGGDPPMRGAGTAVGETWQELDGGRRGPFFHWSIEGRPGCGRYEIAAP